MKKYFLFSILFSTALFLGGCTDQIQTNPEVMSIPERSNVFTFPETEFDFGVLKQSGEKVSTDFSFTYTGESPVEITGVPTSCACASATVSPTKLNPGDTGILTVKFNPNLHAEPEGKFFKTVLLLTEPQITSPEIKIWAEIDLDLGPQAYEFASEHNDEHEETETPSETSYISITPNKFAQMLQEKDFLLIDVHIPEQEHIEKTDILIPYNQISKNLKKLPTNKNAKIVLYCRSGSMSRAAASELSALGYTNVFDLVGGKNAWDKFQKSQ